MAIIDMRIFKTILILEIAVVVQSQPSPISAVLNDKITSINHPESSMSTVKTKLVEIELEKSVLQKMKKSNEPEKILSTKETIEMESKPEASSSTLKPEIPPSNLNPELELAPVSTTLNPQNPCFSKGENCNSKPGNYFDQRRVDYDQRQNGSENYRFQVDGLVLVLAPMEALLLAGGLSPETNGQFNLTSALDQQNSKLKNDKQSSSISFKSKLEKPRQPAQRPTLHSLSGPKFDEGPVSIKLINLIAPLLEPRRH